MRIGLGMVFAGKPTFVARCLYFLRFVYAMCMVLIDWFRRQAAISCYMCYLLGFLMCFDAMDIVF